MKTVKRRIGFIVLLVMIMCFPANALAGEREPVVPMEMNEDAMRTITQELMDALHLKIQHMDVYSASEEMLDLGRSAETLFTANASEEIIISIDIAELAALFMQEMDGSGISREELLELLGNHVGSMMINMQSAQMGVSYTALSSIVTASRCYVADLEQETVVILKYDDTFSIAADFFTSGDHVVTVSESLIPTEMVPQLQAMLAGEIG